MGFRSSNNKMNVAPQIWHPVPSHSTSAQNILPFFFAWVHVSSSVKGENNTSYFRAIVRIKWTDIRHQYLQKGFWTPTLCKTTYPHSIYSLITKNLLCTIHWMDRFYFCPYCCLPFPVLEHSVCLPPATTLRALSGQSVWCTGTQ